MKPFDDAVDVNFVGKETTDATLRHVGRLNGMERLVVDGSPVTDTGLAHLSGLNDLRELSLSNTNTADAGLIQLRKLTSLTRLSLGGTQATDAGLSHLKGLTRLAHLSLERTRVTEAGLSQLQGLASLHILSLDNMQISDMGSKQFAALPGLKVLWVDNRALAETGKTDDKSPNANPAVDVLVGQLDTVAARPHYAHHDDTNAFESVLRQIIDRGGPQTAELLSQKLKREAIEREAATAQQRAFSFNDGAYWKIANDVDRLSNNLELLTALRRVQRQPDPLAIAVALPRDFAADTRKLPTISVMLKSVDIERIPVWVQRARHFHGTRREAQWRFEVRNQNGAPLPIRGGS